MTRIAFDIETNGFLEDASVVYCVCCQDLDTGEKRGFGPFEIEAGIDHLLTATELVGHNILAYDIPVLKRLHPRFDTGDITITDTLVLSRLIHADLYNADHARASPSVFLESHGSHSLKAWGYRLQC